LAYTHFNAEGEIEFKSILFVPKKGGHAAIENYWRQNSEVKLFVRRVLVKEKFNQLLPKYLSFVKGVVDSDDLPLNVAREQVQQSKIMKVISKKLVRKILDMLKKMSRDEQGDEDEEDEDDESAEKKPEEKKDNKESSSTWSTFWTQFGKHLKLGCYDDDANRSKLAKLLRYITTKSEGKEITLDKYLDRMQEKQEIIYYMSGETEEVMRKSSALEAFKKRDLEVLMLTDHLDEPCLVKLAEYEGKKFMSVQKANVKFDETEEEKKRFKKLKEMYKPLIEWMQKSLTELTESGAMKDSGINVEGIELSKRLTESPVIAVSSQHGYSAIQERVMRAQAFQKKDEVARMTGSKLLEINPNHPVIVELLDKVKADKDDKSAHDITHTLFQTALIDAGFPIEDNTALASRVYRLMSKELGVDPDAPLTEFEVPEGDDDESDEDKDDDDDADDEEEIEMPPGEAMPGMPEIKTEL